MALKIISNDLNALEYKTYRLHLAYSLIEGFILGILALNEFVFIKSLKGSSYQVGILFQMSMLVFLLLIFVTEWLKRIHHLRRLLRWVGILTRAPLMLLLFFPRDPETLEGNLMYHMIFLAIFLVYSLAALVINPVINQVLKTNYLHRNFGRLYGITQSANKVIMLIVTFLYGLLLDWDNYAFVYVFPLAALMGVISVFLLSKIPFEPISKEPVRKTIRQSVLDSMKSMYELILKNIPYRHFEISFMFYGFAFMLSYAVITLFFYNALNLNYSSVAFYRNSYNILAIILLPFFGKVIGRIDPRLFGVLTFASILLFLLSIILTEHFPYYVKIAGIQVYYLLILYILFHGVFASTMVLLWNIGASYFGRDHEAVVYQSTHLFLTGFRAIFAPLLGVFFYEAYGFTTTFTIAIALLAVAILIVLWSYKHEKLVDNRLTRK